MLLNIIQQNKIIKDSLVVFLLVYSVVLITLGLFLNEINKATFAHLQPIILPILGINFGYLIAKNRPDILISIYNSAFKLGLILSVIIVIYFFLYQFSYVVFFGASSAIFVSIFWAFSKKKWLILIFFLFILLLTGKRSASLAIAAVLVISTLRGGKPIQNLLFCGLMAIMWIVYGLNNENFVHLFSRYILIYDTFAAGGFASYGLSGIDLEMLDVATSGRINDIIGIATALNEDPIYWIIGKGIGALFNVDTPSGVWVTHYSHFTPISYVFLGGIILFVAVYSKLISLLVYSIKYIDNYYCKFFVYYFITSLIGGAVYFSDPFIWLFVGVIVHQKKFHTKNTIV